MKIKSIMCNSSEEFFKAHFSARHEMETNEIELLICNIKKGPHSLESSFDEALAGPYILKEVYLAEAEGCDAIVIDCAADPVLRAARQVANIPVVAAGECSHHAAMMLCDRFSIITTMEVSISQFRENIEKYGYSSRVASVRALNIHVLDLEDEEKTFEALRKTAFQVIKEDGAEAIVLGCTGMLLVRDRLQKCLGVPVVEPLTMGIQYAAAMVRAGLTHSRIPFGLPSEYSIKLLESL